MRTTSAEKMRWSQYRSVLLAAAGGAVLVTLAMGQTSKPSATLEERVATLERAVARLERRVAALERAPKSPTRKKEEPRSSPWSRLRKGMTADEVRELLGDPDEVHASPWGTTTWKYGPVAWVAFDRDMRVTRWYAP